MAHKTDLEKWLITEWSPVHLKRVLGPFYFKDGAKKVGALKVWQDFNCYLFLPRLVNSHVFEMAITQGIETEDFFGYAAGKEDTIDLDPIEAKMDFATLVDAVAHSFTARVGVDVALSMEIRAQAKNGFDESLRRAVQENRQALKFGAARFA